VSFIDDNLLTHFIQYTKMPKSPSKKSAKKSGSKKSPSKKSSKKAKNVVRKFKKNPAGSFYGRAGKSANSPAEFAAYIKALTPAGYRSTLRAKVAMSNVLNNILERSAETVRSMLQNSGVKTITERDAEIFISHIPVHCGGGAAGLKFVQAQVAKNELVISAARVTRRIKGGARMGANARVAFAAAAQHVLKSLVAYVAASMASGAGAVSNNPVTKAESEKTTITHEAVNKALSLNADWSKLAGGQVSSLSSAAAIVTVNAAITAKKGSTAKKTTAKKSTHKKRTAKKASSKKNKKAPKRN
jgi:hypothetical protein